MISEISQFHFVQEASRMSGKIFISYRREDNPVMAHLIKKSLEGSGSVFLDSISIAVGTNFVDAIRRAIPECKIFLVLIGNRWNPKRLYASEDKVRMEIQVALASGVEILPVRFEGAPMPREDEIPRVLHPFLSCHSAELRTDTLDADLQRVVKRIVEILRNRHLRWYRHPLWQRARSPEFILSLSPLLQVLLSCAVLGPLGHPGQALLLTGAALPSLAAIVIFRAREPLASSMFLFGGMVMTAGFSLMILASSVGPFLSVFTAFLGVSCGAASGYLGLLCLRASKA
jgi:TIR domain